jgi:hypothetical protein
MSPDNPACLDQRHCSAATSLVQVKADWIAARNAARACYTSRICVYQLLRGHPGRDAGFTLRPPDRSEHALLTLSAPTSGV